MTKRLFLRQMELGDAEALFAIKSNSKVTNQYGQEPHQSLDQTRGWVRQRLEDYQKRNAIFWVVTLEEMQENVIGAICFWNFDSTFNCAEVGYELDPSYWGKGIMKEGLSAILDYGFNSGLHRVEANPFAFNESSVKLLTKLGFRHEGTLRERCLFHGKFVDRLYFGLLKDDWISFGSQVSRDS